MRSKKLKKAFTLVELVVVIAVIAVLAGVSVGAYFGITSSAEDSKLTQEAKFALNSVKMSAINPEGNYKIDVNGITIENSNTATQYFNYQVNNLAGINYVITYQLPDKIIGPTLYFFDSEETSSLNGNSALFDSFCCVLHTETSFSIISINK